MRPIRYALLVLPTLASSLLPAQAPTEGDARLRNFRLQSGETLSELRIHYRTYGTPRKDTSGVVHNAVFILHSTTGSGAQFTGPASRVGSSASVSPWMPRRISLCCPTA
ncbi:hypothetical protein [Geothrix alkalitolerans]|uniref:hypothetical protein n=1 Tax=Geothrix alkalitolerans TaxID=2922724 RepID=UPI001FAF5944|nr:hypothetical protein [Geothrix alkalitolerans]